MTLYSSNFTSKDVFYCLCVGSSIRVPGGAFQDSFVNIRQQSGHVGNIADTMLPTTEGIVAEKVESRRVP
jgi:hypothetical protein